MFHGFNVPGYSKCKRSKFPLGSQLVQKSERHLSTVEVNMLKNVSVKPLKRSVSCTSGIAWDVTPQKSLIEALLVRCVSQCYLKKKKFTKLEEPKYLLLGKWCKSWYTFMREYCAVIKKLCSLRVFHDIAKGYNAQWNLKKYYVYSIVSAM